MIVCACAYLIVCNSKKDPDVRRKELLQELVPQFMEVLVPAQRTCPGLLHSLIASQFGNAFVLELALYVTGTPLLSQKMTLFISSKCVQVTTKRGYTRL